MIQFISRKPILSNRRRDARYAKEKLLELPLRAFASSRESLSPNVFADFGVTGLL
jgi:hypothetical protein